MAAMEVDNGGVIHDEEWHARYSRQMWVQTLNPTMTMLTVLGLSVKLCSGTGW